MLNYIYLFAKVEPFLYPLNETNLIGIYDLFNMLLNSLCRYFIEYFCICSSRKLGYGFLFVVVFFFCRKEEFYYASRLRGDKFSKP
jgi:hypothetical protein